MATISPSFVLKMKGFEPSRWKRGPRRIVGLEIDPFGDDQAEDLILVIDAGAAEHGADLDLAEGREEIGRVITKGGGDRHRTTPPWSRL